MAELKRIVGKTYIGLLNNREMTTDGCQNYNRRSIDGFCSLVL